MKAENFKKLLYKQKQLNSHIVAFAHIVRELSSLNEDQAKHIMQIFMLGIKIHASIFEGYKVYLYRALVLMINSMFKHDDLIFKFWLKKVVKQTLVSITEIPVNLAAAPGSEIYNLRNSSLLLINLFTHPEWTPGAKEAFALELIKGVVGYFENSQLAYTEMFREGQKFFIPANHIDQHLTHRIAIIFDEVQRHKVIDEFIIGNFSTLLSTTSKLIKLYPRTASLQKMAKSLFSIADRLEGDILRDTPENFTIIEEIVESQYAASKEMQNEILTDCVKTILQTPSFLLKKDLKFIEYIKRVVIIGLEEARSQNIHLVMNIIGVLDKILVQGVIEFNQGREEFLEDVLPFFSSLLVLEEQKKKQEINHSLTIEEAFLTRAEILDRIIRFLGSLGSESKYMTKNQ